MAEHSFFKFGSDIIQTQYAITPQFVVAPVEVKVTINNPAMTTHGLISILGISADILVNVAFLHPQIFEHNDPMEFRNWFNGSCSGRTWFVRYICVPGHYFNLPFSLDDMVLKSNYGPMKSYLNTTIPAIYFEHAGDLMMFKLAWNDAMVASYQKKEPDSTEPNKIDYRALRKRLADNPTSTW